MAPRSKPLSPEDVRGIFEWWLEGTMPADVSRAFEQSYPDLVRQHRAKTGVTAQPPTPSGLAALPQTIDPMSGLPIARSAEEAEALRTGMGEAGREVARFGIPTATSMAGTALGTAGGLAAAPFTGGLSAVAGPIVGEMLGSFAGRRLSVGLGLDEQGKPILGPLDPGDIASIAIPGGMGAARLGKRAIGQFIAPSMRREAVQTLRQPIAGETAEDLIKRGSSKTRYEQGTLVQQTWEQHEQEILQQARQNYAPIKQVVPDFDFSDIEQAARTKNVSLADAKVGSELTRGTDPITGDPFANVSFDDAITIRSRLLRYERSLERTDPGKARAYGTMAKAVDDRMAQQADSVGLKDQWREVNQWYKTEYIGRFKNKLVENLMRTARTSGEDLINQLEGMSVKKAEAFLKGLSATGQGSGVALETARQEARAGLISKLLEESTPNKRTGVLQADTLLNRLKGIPEETRGMLFGHDLSESLMEFASKLGGAKTRTALTIGLGGALGTGAAVAGNIPMAGIGPSVLGMASMLEAANEWNFLAKLLVSNPRIARRLTDAVLQGSVERLAKVTGMQRLGIIGSQTIPRIEGMPSSLGFGPPSPIRD